MREEDLRASFTLGGKGTAKGDGVRGVFPGVTDVEILEFKIEGFGDDRGDLEGLGDFVMSRSFEGDLESERLNERTAEVTST